LDYRLTFGHCGNAPFRSGQTKDFDCPPYRSKKSPGQFSAAIISPAASNTRTTRLRPAVKFSVANGGVGLLIPETTERQGVGNQIKAATIFARSDAFKTALYFGVFISTFATQFPITHTRERLIKLAELPTRHPARHE
jgi:hypothetical protein